MTLIIIIIINILWSLLISLFYIFVFAYFLTRANIVISFWLLVMKVNKQKMNYFYYHYYYYDNALWGSFSSVQAPRAIPRIYFNVY
jgi:hypothetical protein